MLAEFEPLLAHLIESQHFYPYFQGERNKEEASLVRLCLVVFNGDFVIHFKECASVDYSVDKERHTITGLFPLSIEELVIYMLHIMPVVFYAPLVAFVRAFMLEWVMRSPMAAEWDRIDVFLASLGI